MKLINDEIFYIENIREFRIYFSVDVLSHINKDKLQVIWKTSTNEKTLNPYTKYLHRLDGPAVDTLGHPTIESHYWLAGDWYKSSEYLKARECYLKLKHNANFSDKMEAIVNELE